MKAKVYYKDLLAGYISYSDGLFSFWYDESYLNSNSMPISLTLPLCKTVYSSDMILPFFDGLLPEGYLLYEVVKYYNIKPTDRAELLMKCCTDPIGAVRVEEIYE